MNKTPLSTWNALLALSLIVLVGALCFQQFFPAPQSKFPPERRKMDEAKARTAIAEMEAKQAEAVGLLERYVWPGDAKLAEAEAMARVTGLAKKHSVSLGAFRPQKPIEDAGLRRLPFSLNLEGPYPNIVRFVRELETATNRLAVQMLQVSASDATSDLVSAIMTIVAFQKLETPKPKEPANPAVPAGASNPSADGPDASIAEATGKAGPKTDVSATPAKAPSSNPVGMADSG